MPTQEIREKTPKNNNKLEEFFRYIAHKRNTELKNRERAGKKQEANHLLAHFPGSEISTPKTVTPSNIAIEIKQKCEENNSRILTRVYTKLIEALEKRGYSEIEARDHAGVFMREYGVLFQGAMSTYTDPSVLSREIRSYANEYLRSVSKGGGSVKSNKLSLLAESTPATLPNPEKIIEEEPSPIGADTGETQPDPTNIVPLHEAVPSENISSQKKDEYIDEDIYEDDREFSAAMVDYQEMREESFTFYNDNGFFPEEYGKDNDQEKTIPVYNEYTLPEDIDIRDVITKPGEIFSDMEPGESRSLILPVESGVTEGECVALQNGDFIIRLQNLDYYIDANGSKNEAQEELSFLTGIHSNPILRRMLWGNSGQFGVFRRALESRYGGVATDIYTNPTTFSKYAIALLAEKCGEPEEVWVRINDELSRANISGAQSILTNNRDEILSALRNSKIIAESGIGYINTKMLLS